jgi:GntR family transcriptional regulator
MNLLRRGPTPYYHQIGAIIREKIVNGELRSGDRIPTENELQQMFEVSRATVRQALQNLEQDGLISRQPGKGSFVQSSPEAVAEVKVTCLLEDLIALGVPAENRVISTAVVRASNVVAEALAVAPGDDVFTFQRVVEVDGDPFAGSRTFLPLWMKDYLNEKDLADAQMLKTLQRVCDVLPDRADQLLEAVMADASQANLLNVDAGAALLSCTRSTYDRHNTGLEHSVTLYRSDRTRFHISQRQRKNEANDWVLASRGPLGSRDIEKSFARQGGKRRASGKQ